MISAGCYYCYYYYSYSYYYYYYYHYHYHYHYDDDYYYYYYYIFSSFCQNNSENDFRAVEIKLRKTPNS